MRQPALCLVHESLLHRADGGRKKREAIFSRLDQDGFPDVRSRVITPIGLDIRAQTPAEIAISVAAQLIAWRAGLS